MALQEICWDCTFSELEYIKSRDACTIWYTYILSNKRVNNIVWYIEDNLVTLEASVRDINVRIEDRLLWHDIANQNFALLNQNFPYIILILLTEIVAKKKVLHELEALQRASRIFLSCIY